MFDIYVVSRPCSAALKASLAKQMTMLLDRRSVLLDPVAELQALPGERFAESRQCIFDLRRNRRMHSAIGDAECTTLAFIGITDVEFVVTEGEAFGPEQREAALKGAFAQIGRIEPVALAA